MVSPHVIPMERCFNNDIREYGVKYISEKPRAIATKINIENHERVGKTCELIDVSAYSRIYLK